MLGEKIRELRRMNNLTQSDLANKLNSQYGLKVDRVMVSKWETGFQTPVISTITCLSKLFNVTMDYLGGDESSSVPTPSTGVLVPVLGYVKAGIPITAVENIVDYEEISKEDAEKGDHFALIVRGDSMEPRFSDGDVVIVRKQETVENGEIAVVLVNGDEATVKRFYKNEKGIKLISTNPKYDPFFFTPEEVSSLPVQILGRVVELRAKF